LALFADVLPVRAARIRDEVGWLAGELGEVRDLDVQIVQTAQWRAEAGEEERSGLGELADSLNDARRGARQHLVAALDSRRYERLGAALSELCRRGAPRRGERARTMAVVALPELLGERQRLARKASRRAHRSGVPTDFHRLRIRIKRLRYALEFADGVYEGATRRYARLLAALQDELGLMQDAAVAAERLRQVALAGNGVLSLEAVFAVGGVAERYRRDSERLLAHLRKSHDVVDGGQWQRLEQLMARRRDAQLERLAALRARPVPRVTTRRVVGAGGADPAVEPSSPTLPEVVTP
jgi:CHAD domain-containing protein